MKESASVLGMSESSAYEAIANDSFPVRVLRINGRIYVPKAALEAVLCGAVGGDTTVRACFEAMERTRALRDQRLRTMPVS